MLYSNANYARVLAAEAAGRAARIAARAPLRERVARRLNELKASAGGVLLEDLELEFPDEVDRLTPELLAEAKKLAGKMARG